MSASQAPTSPPSPPSREQRAAVRAWCLYDWANSAFATSVITAILPPYFAHAAGATLPPNMATANWGYASAVALLFATVTAPILGASADHLGRRKPLLFGLVLVGCLTTALLAISPPGSWRVLLVLFGVGFVAFASANVLYDSLLPAVARPSEMHRVSARGFAYGYLGGGILLALNLAWITFPQRFGLPNSDAAVRLSFASVAVWWLLFSIPLFRRVPEPESHEEPLPMRELPLSVMRRLSGTLAGIRHQPELFRFLIAFWLYSDGIGTVIKMATVYGSEVGIGRSHLIGALLLTQLIAAPASVAFGRLAHWIGPQRAVLLGLMGYVGITCLGYFLRHAWQFWMLAGLVGLVQGGTQALSRSMFASLVPRRKLSELFGFYSVSEKLAGVVGPVLFGLVAQVSGAGRFAVLTLLPFFLGGAWLLMTVDLEAGHRRAMQGGGRGAAPKAD